MKTDNYIKESLKTHIFFTRTLREHAIFLELAILEKDKDLKDITSYFQKLFTDILNTVVSLSKGYIDEDDIKEFITNNTLKSEELLQSLSGIEIDTNITTKEQKLEFDNILKNGKLIDKISSINKRILPIINNFIYLKNDILNKVDTKNMYIHYYKTMIKHFIDEEKIYYITIKNLLDSLKLQEKNLNINIEKLIKEHLEFMKDMIDPNEKEIIHEIDNYLLNYSNNNLEEIRDFSKKEEENIINGNINSIMIPLYIDHTIRETNYILSKLNGR